MALRVGTMLLIGMGLHGGLLLASFHVKEDCSPKQSGQGRSVQQVLAWKHN